ncbi:hypothetical protein [Paenibacillus sp. GCM10012303]|uniref:hypothetical protein n=1 Tax=Paenibacillus sp. GCM10012303 TaxID=3317340 RepID=UPI0036150A4B
MCSQRRTLPCTEDNGELAFYDPKTLEPLESGGLAERLSSKSVVLPNDQKTPVIPLKNGKLAGFRGQDYVIVDAPASKTDDKISMPKRCARSEGRSVLGPDGGIWNGWSAKYVRRSR